MESVDKERFGANPVLSEGATQSKDKSSQHNAVRTNREAKWRGDPWTRGPNMERAEQ